MLNGGGVRGDTTGFEVVLMQRLDASAMLTRQSSGAKGFHPLTGLGEGGGGTGDMKRFTLC